MSDEPKCMNCGHPDECRNEQRARIAELEAALRPFVYYKDRGYIAALGNIDRWIERAEPLPPDEPFTISATVRELIAARTALEGK